MRYDEFKSLIVNSTPDRWIYDDELGKYIFLDDIAISITISRHEGYLDEEFFEDWARNFPDEKARKIIFQLNYNGTLIENFFMVAVDGFRSYIPFPNLDGMTITNEQYSIGKIINKRLDEVGHKFNDYLQRAGITVS